MEAVKAHCFILPIETLRELAPLEVPKVIVVIDFDGTCLQNSLS